MILKSVQSGRGFDCRSWPFAPLLPCDGTERHIGWYCSGCRRL